MYSFGHLILCVLFSRFLAIVKLGKGTLNRTLQKSGKNKFLLIKIETEICEEQMAEKESTTTGDNVVDFVFKALSQTSRSLG